ncbi:unnamed protein product, partial [Didymodactylos carnosus]
MLHVSCSTTNVTLDKAVAILTNISSMNTTAIADAVTDYFAVLDTSLNSTTRNASLLVDANVLDNVIDNGITTSVARNTTELYLRAASPNIFNATLLIGAAFRSSRGGTDVTNVTNVTQQIRDILAAAVVSETEQFRNVSLLKLLLIKRPDNYLQHDTNSSKLSSSVILVGTTPNINNTSVQLYFTLIYNRDLIDPTQTDRLQCSFWNGAGWDRKGCQGAPTPRPDINSDSIAYECNCNHFTTFALIWLPANVLGVRLCFFVRAAETSVKGKQQRKRVVLVLLTACTTQSLAWIF